MKKISSILLSICLILSLTACTPAPVTQDITTAPSTTEPSTTEPSTTEPSTEEVPSDEEDPFQQGEPSSPILYKVTDEEGHIVYLFGSIHIGTDEMYPLPDYVMDAYESADALAVECDISAPDTSLLIEAIRPMVLTDGTKISDHISQETYDAAVEILKENGSYMPLLDMYKPVMWYSSIESFAVIDSGADPNAGIDMYLLELAHEQDKPIYEIESIALQYEILGNLSMELQCLLLEDAIASYHDPAASQLLLDMCTTWANGDEQALLELVSTDTTDIDEELLPLYQEFDDALSGDRDLDMTQYARDALSSGQTVFICVGAAHIVGPGAMADLLTQDGYTVERIEN